MSLLENPIIQNVAAYGDFPIRALDEATLELFLASLAKFPGKRGRPLLHSFEGFLQITNQRLNFDELNSPKFVKVSQQFVGAINSPKFIELSADCRYLYCVAFSKGLKSIQLDTANLQLPEFHISTRRTTDFVKTCVEEFNALDLDKEAVWLWRAWMVESRTGKKIWLPLYPVYSRLGRSFTEKLHAACADYVSARRLVRVPLLKEFAKFISNYPETISESDFRSSQFITRFWREFLDHYIRTKFQSGRQISLLIREWREGFTFFVREALIGSGLIAEQFGLFPAPPPRKIYGSQTNLRHQLDGSTLKTRLLTHIPLQISDKDALELLFNDIQKDVDLIVRWAELAAKDLWSRFLRRERFGPEGIARMYGPTPDNEKKCWIISRSNPNHLKNAAATFKHFGYLTNFEIEVQKTYPLPLSKTAYELGLPITGALLPHCVLLIANHPAITPSFLENFELFDKSGQLIGLLQAEDKFVLNGVKARKGPSKSQQIIPLTNESLKIVQQVIAITEPLRKYLRTKGDDNWRYLLLTSKSAFGYPSRIRNLTTDTSDARRVSSLAENLSSACDLPITERTAYAQRFSLASLRASVGVLVYLETKDVRKMAEALGHSCYNTDLLSRYLPEPILAFFQERWIRVFQEGMILEALKDSEHLLECSSFSTIDELDDFLKAHALKEIPSSNAPVRTQPRQKNFGSSEVILGIDVGVLTVLLSISDAVQNSSRKANLMSQYWAQISAHITEHIESDRCQREDLKHFLKIARNKSDPRKVEHLLYE